MNDAIPQPPTPGRLEFGPVTIKWDPAVEFPLAVNHHALGSLAAFQFVTVSQIVFVRGPFDVIVPAGFCFDGATIPRWFWWIPGFAPVGPHLWAALCHDWLCVEAVEHPANVDRDIADAVFASLLTATNVGWRGLVMDLAVSAYRRWNQLQGALA